MKYWWLEKYRNFKFIQINELEKDIDYFLIMPKNYDKQYQILKEKAIEELLEEELLNVLKKTVETRRLKDISLLTVIKKLLLIPDNSFPPSDYTLKEQLIEIKNLKQNPPFHEKLGNNNICICYHCLNVFYIDKIKNINKKNLCLCPYCLKSTLYFDNDYIPMNYNFLRLANIYYHTSNLGCTFKEIQKIIRKDITIEIGEQEKNMISFSSIFNGDKIKPIDEKVMSRKLYQNFMLKEANLIDKAQLYIPNLSFSNRNEILENILVTILQILSNTVYLKKIALIFESEKDKKEFSELLKIIKNFSKA